MIVGVGETELGRVSNRTTMSLHIEAARAAIYDAGLSKDDIDGVLCIHPVLAETPRFHMFFSEQMGIFVKTLCDSLTIGGASPGHALQVARWAIESGQCKAVLVVGAESLLTGSGGDSGGGVASYATLGAHSLEFEYPYGAHIPAFYALLAKRYMHEFGTTSEQLARIAVACRKHAALNPKAQMREPITVDDVLTSKAVSTPLRKLDCSLISGRRGGSRHNFARKGPRPCAPADPHSRNRGSTLDVPHGPSRQGGWRVRLGQHGLSGGSKARLR
ncbi:MAG: thiolase family protein [Burkholderiaceae bacterium]|nr:thiolase family protein [Burkholderiaceae bacterium]